MLYCSNSQTLGSIEYWGPPGQYYGELLCNRLRLSYCRLGCSVETGEYYYQGYEFIELKSVEGAACKLPGSQPNLSLWSPTNVAKQQRLRSSLPRRRKCKAKTVEIKTLRRFRISYGRT